MSELKCPGCNESLQVISQYPFAVHHICPSHRLAAQEQSEVTAVNLPVIQSLCYRCGEMLGRYFEHGGHAVGQVPAPATKPCQYQLCRACVRAFCEGPVAEDKQLFLDAAYLEGKTDSRDLAPCGCALCRSEDFLAVSS
jgi:hypothetical protein